MIDPGPLTYKHTVCTLGDAATTLVVAANAARRYLLIQSIAAAVAHLKVGAAAVANEGILLNPGATAANGQTSFEMSVRKGNLDTRVVNGIGTNTEKLLVTEGVC